MNKGLLAAGILAVVAGVVRALVALVPLLLSRLVSLPYDQAVPLGRVHELLIVPAIEEVFPLLLFAVALFMLQIGLARQTGRLGWICALAAIIGVALVAVGIAAASIATSYDCTLDAACQGTPSSRALDVLHTLGVVGALLLAATLLSYALVALRGRLALRWAGAFAVMGLAALALLPPELQSNFGGLLTALSIGFPGYALVTMWVAVCFLLAGAAFSASTPEPMPAGVPAPQP